MGPLEPVTRPEVAMPALVPTAIVGHVTWLGVVPDRGQALSSDARERLILGYGGPEGEAHGGVTRPSCSRVATLYPRGTEIRNARQVSLVCADELVAIARAMGVLTLDPAWLGATMVIRGIPDFSHVPPSSRLQFANGTTLTVDMENVPCHLPAAVIDAALPGMGRRFKAAAAGLRGVTAWVEREGFVERGEAVRLFVPQQRAWQGAVSGQRQPGREREYEAANETCMDEKAGGSHGVSPIWGIGESTPST